MQTFDVFFVVNPDRAVQHKVELPLILDIMKLMSYYYRKTPSISRTKFENLNLSSILLPLSSLNPLKPGVKLRMKM